VVKRAKKKAEERGETVSGGVWISTQRHSGEEEEKSLQGYIDL